MRAKEKCPRLREQSQGHKDKFTAISLAETGGKVNGKSEPIEAHEKSAAGCAIITLAYGAEKILERVVKPPRRRKRAARPGAEIIDIGKYRSWRDAVRVYETVTTDREERQA